MKPTTCSNTPYPLWTVIDLLPVGTAALYMHNVALRNAVLGALMTAVETGGTFLGERAIRGVAYSDPELSDAADVKKVLELGVKLLILYGGFKAIKDSKYKNRHVDYFVLNRLAHHFKATIVLVPEKRTDAVDFAVDTVISFTVPTSVDDDAPHHFKVEARDVPLIRGLATFDPATGQLVA